MPAEPTGNAPVPDPRMAQALSRDRRRVVLSYLVMALAWMISTDSVVQALVPDPQQAALWQGLKGSFFALASGAFGVCRARPASHSVRHSRESKGYSFSNAKRRPWLSAPRISGSPSSRSWPAPPPRPSPSSSRKRRHGENV